MKRAFATLGVVGLAVLSVTAPASAANEVYLCHATSSASNPYVIIGINHSGLHGHDQDTDDIIPPNEFLDDGQNWAAGEAIHANDCEPVTTPPVVVVPEVVPPVVVPEVVPPVVVPEVVPPVVVPPAVVVPPVVVPPAAQTPVPKAAPAKAPAAAAAPVSQGTNQGYNAQTAIGGNAGDGAPTWLGGLGALLVAGLAVAARRRSRTE